MTTMEAPTGTCTQVESGHVVTLDPATTAGIACGFHIGIVDTAEGVRWAISHGWYYDGPHGELQDLVYNTVIWLGRGSFATGGVTTVTTAEPDATVVGHKIWRDDSTSETPEILSTLTHRVSNTPGTIIEQGPCPTGDAERAHLLLGNALRLAAWNTFCTDPSTAEARSIGNNKIATRNLALLKLDLDTVEEKLNELADTTATLMDKRAKLLTQIDELARDLT